jgi:predicted deacylase
MRTDERSCFKDRRDQISSDYNKMKTDKDDDGTITVAGHRIERGQSKALSLPVGDIVCPGLEDETTSTCNSSTVLPLTVINGNQTGPTLLVLAGIHGSEYAPILGTRRLAKKYGNENNNNLSGTLILVHIANMPMFLGRNVYTSPVDGKNLNRIFPGLKNGTWTEQIAFVLTNELYPLADFVMDVHSGDANEQLAPSYTAYYGNVRSREEDNHIVATSKRMAECFGNDLVVEFQWELTVGKATTAIWAGAAAVARGIPSMDVEVARNVGPMEKSIQTVENGIENVMHCMRMIAIETVPHSESTNKMPPLIKERHLLEAPIDGVWTPTIEAGVYVEKGDIVGFLSDWHGMNRIWNATAPSSGLLLIQFVTPPTQQGDTVAVVAVLPDGFDHNHLPWHTATAVPPTQTFALFGLLIALACLVSAVIGCLVGRVLAEWQRKKAVAYHLPLDISNDLEMKQLC